MVNLVLSNLEILHSLGRVLTHMLLLLIQLIDNLILVGNLIIKRPDVVIPVGLLLLQLLDCKFKVLNVLLNSNIVSFKSLLILSGLLALSLHLYKLVTSFS